MFKKEEKKIDIEEMLKNLGLEELDNDDKITISTMLTNFYLPDTRNTGKIDIGTSSAHAAIYSIYNQNYIFLKYILKIVKQNTEIIELLTEIKNK